MPELPEVETIRKGLQKFLISHTIKKVEVHYKNFEGNPKKLEGGKVKGVRRFGKVLCIDLDNDYSLIIHVKLTGQLIYRGPNLKNPGLSKKIFGGVPGKHTHATFALDKNGVLYYNDYRKFGWLKVVKTKDVEDITFIKKLGPEPLDGLTLEKFRNILSSTKRAVKIVIMDQSKMGGVGNIYANDALFLAKIDPRKQADKLNQKEAGNLYEAIEEVLKRGLKYEGASELAYVTPAGKEGGYQNHALVYGREGEQCKKDCGGKIKKIKLGGRGTYFCPNCQKRYVNK